MDAARLKDTIQIFHIRIKDKKYVKVIVMQETKYKLKPYLH